MEKCGIAWKKCGIAWRETAFPARQGEDWTAHSIGCTSSYATVWVVGPSRTTKVPHLLPWRKTIGLVYCESRLGGPVPEVQCGYTA